MIQFKQQRKKKRSYSTVKQSKNEIGLSWSQSHRMRDLRIYIIYTHTHKHKEEENDIDFNDWFCNRHTDTFKHNKHTQLTEMFLILFSILNSSLFSLSKSTK